MKENDEKKINGELFGEGLDNLNLEEMENNVEHEICNNCKKEIPQTNYVMHTMHCARNITLCKTCKEPFPKAQFADHEKSCKKPAVVQKPFTPPSLLEKSSYFQTRKAIEDKKGEVRKERYMQKMDRLVDSGYTLGENSSAMRSARLESLEKCSLKSSNSYDPSDMKQTGSMNPHKTNIEKETVMKKINENSSAASPLTKTPDSKLSGMLTCKYCDLELPKLELEDHENYCGTRTDKCLECGELVMFKNKQVHLDSNHGFVKLTDEPGPRPSWDSATQRSSATIDSPIRRRHSPFMPITDFEYDPMPYLPSSYQVPGGGAKKKEGESYKEISRRLDCKTEYIRNLLHDSAGITVPLRRSGAVPRNHFNHNKGPAPQPPHYRKRNPPTELVIPCEFCGVPVPHEELIQHETGCRPDLARFNPRRRSPEPDDYFIAPQPSSPEVELPCEFCGDMIPASQLLGHQIRCS